MCTNEGYKLETLWSLFMEKIDMSQDYVLLLVCRLISRLPRFFNFDENSIYIRSLCVQKKVM